MIVRLLLAAIALLFVSAPARADVEVSVSYSETADLYSTMDNVSEWLKGYTIAAYREEWEKRFGWSVNDQKWVDRYAAYRRRTFVNDLSSSDPRTLPDGIFASREETMDGTDPLSTHFLKHSAIETALRDLDRVATLEDARMLRGFYRHFEAKWRLLLAESEPLKTRAAELQARLDAREVSTFLDTVNSFYRSEIDGAFKVFFTRRPPGNETSAEPLAGAFVLLHSPVAEENTSYWDTIVLHELVHYVSARQPREQKQALTARFLDRCPMPDGVSRYWLFEEPLAVAWGQAAYSAKVLQSPLNPKENWYAILWVEVVSRTIASSIIDGYGNDERIEDIIDEAADRCLDLTAIANRLGR